MIILNVTHSVDKGAAEDWISWMKDQHIPALLKKKQFESCRMLKVLSHDDEATFSYAVQYNAQSIEKIEEYLNSHIDEIQRRYGDSVITYPTLLEEV